MAKKQTENFPLCRYHSSGIFQVLVMIKKKKKKRRGKLLIQILKLIVLVSIGLLIQGKYPSGEQRHF